MRAWAQNQIDGWGEGRGEPTIVCVRGRVNRTNVFTP